MDFFNFLIELNNECVDCEFGGALLDDDIEDAFCTIQEGIFNIDYIFIKEDFIELLFSNKRFKIEYENIQYTSIVGTRLYKQNQTLSIGDNSEYLQLIKDILNISKKYNLNKVKQELEHFANICKINSQNILEYPQLFILYYNEILDFIQNNNDEAKEILLEYFDVIIKDGCAYDAIVELLDTQNHNDILKFKYDSKICDKNLFYNNITPIMLCRLNNIIDMETKIHDIIYSNNGSDDVNLEDLAKKGIQNILNNGIKDTMFGFIKNVGKKTISDDKIVIILIDNKVVNFDLDNSTYVEYSLQEALNFIHKKDNYFPNALDIFENNMSDEPILNNVDNLAYAKFYKKLQEITDPPTLESKSIIDKKSKLLELKELFDDGLIDESEYKTQKQKILDN